MVVARNEKDDETITRGSLVVECFTVEFERRSTSDFARKIRPGQLLAER
jgi:hypothetical protein